MSDLQDSELVERSLRGDESCFAELISRYRTLVWRTVYRRLRSPADSEDAVQEVFFRAFMALSRFDTRCSFGPWINRIAVNCGIDHLRRRKSRVRLWGDLSEAEQQRCLRNLNTRAVPNQLCENVAETLICKLRPKQRTAFVLRELDGFSYGDIATVLETSEMTVRVLVSRARASIRRSYQAYDTA
jgi:RNA polymerase sigma-70 factor, ECF subfamily